jgi:hypothetical protein
MSRRLAAVLAVALVVFGAFAAFLLLRRGGDDDAELARLSAPQRPYKMPIPNPLGGPGSPEPTGEAFVIAERKGFRLVRLPRRDGTSCWGTHELRFGDWQLANYGCETTFQRFPDPQQPLRVMGTVFYDMGTQLLEYQTFFGLAADGVHSVGVIDARERMVPVARVQGNAFWADPPTDPVKSVVALDDDGEVIWRTPPAPLPDE